MMNMNNVSFDLNIFCLFQSNQMYIYPFLFGGSRMVKARLGRFEFGRLGDILIFLLGLDLTNFIQGIDIISYII